MSALNEYDVIIADDDPDDLEILHWGLKEAGVHCTIRHAKDGSALFQLLKERMPYILFLDINMPCEDGISCVAALRKNPVYDKLPIVMYSSLVYGTYVDEAYRNGANYFMAKPDTATGIVSNLKKIFAIDWANYQHVPSRDEFLIK